MWRQMGMCVVAAAAVCFLISSGVQADSYTYELDFEFSGDTYPNGVPPEGTPPWLTATFDDGGTPGSVDLVLETTNLTDKEFLFEWLFNLDPSLDVGILVFSAPIKTGAFEGPTVNTAVDHYMANGDGYFDIQFLFDNSDGPPKRFGVGDGVQYTITDDGLNTITANSFHVLSFEDGGEGEYITAAHVGGIGPTNDFSGWIAPEPGALSLLAIGGLALLRRKRK